MENMMIATWELMSDQHLYFVREALVITGSSNTRDTNNIIESIVKMQQSNIIISTISLIGMTYIFQQMCQKTKGKYEVALNEHDFKVKLMVA
jgi:Ssl1-like